jgi:hypothetical protein
MRINVTSTNRLKRQQGLATILMLILLALVFGFIFANMNTLSTLHNDVKRVEQRQLRRINPPAPSASTNSPSAQAPK